MAAAWIFSLCFLACGVTSAGAAALKQRHKRETLSSGWLASPGYPNTFYPNDCKQDFTIQTDPTRPCRVTIRYVADIEWASGCVYDRLVLNAGRPDERVVCGNTNDQVVTYTTTVEDGNGVQISFTSDSTQSAKGYRLEYTVEPIEPAINTYSQYNTAAPQGRAIDDGLQSTGNYASERWGNSGTFSSPSYPNAYPGNYDGTYLAHLDYNGPQTVRVNYNYDIEYQENCLFDYLEYVNTGQRVCGNSRGTVDIPVSGNSFELRFHSDNSDNRQGFTLDYQVVPQFQSRSLSLSGDTSSGAVTEVASTTPSNEGGPADYSSLPPTDGGSGTSPESGTASTELPVARSAVVNTDSDAVALQEAVFVTAPPVVSASPPLVSLPVTETDVLATSGDQVCYLCEWTQYGDYDYSYNHRMLTFDDAVAACTGCGGQLVSAEDQEHFDLTQRIFSELSGSPDIPHWLSATDRGTEGQWTWLDGTPLSYTKWKRREPDNLDDTYSNADCLVVNSKGDWRDQECTHPRKSLCRRPLGLEVPCIPSPDYPEDLSGTDQGSVTPPSFSDVMDVEQTAGTTPFTPPPPPTTLPPQPPLSPVPEEVTPNLFPDEPLVTSVPVDQIEGINVFVPPGEECCSLSEWRAYGDYEYSYNHRGLTFDQAVSACASCGGQLITAANDDEFALTQRIFAALSGAEDIAHWLAATDRGAEGQWTWLDSTPLSYNNWKRREPDNQDDNGSRADCLVVNSKGLWRDQSCQDTRKSLCKRPTGTVVEPLAMCVETELAVSTLSPAPVGTPDSVTSEPEAEVSLGPTSGEGVLTSSLPPVDQITGINVYAPADVQCCSLSEWRAYGDYEYSYNHRGLTFDQAVSACASCGGQLITAANDDEFALTQRIFAALSGADGIAHWLAATDRGAEGQWTWLDGTLLSYNNWKRREPDNQDENGSKADCLVVNSKGLWRDQNCLDTRKSLCKRPTGTVVAPLDMCLDIDSTAPTSAAATTSPPPYLTTTGSRPNSEVPQSPTYPLPTYATTGSPPERPYSTPFYETTTNNYDRSYIPSERPYSTPFYETTTNNYDRTYIPSERPYYTTSCETSPSPTDDPPVTHDNFPPETPSYYTTEGSWSETPVFSPSGSTAGYPPSGTTFQSGSTLNGGIAGLSTPSEGTADDTVRGNSGYITSPNYPSVYPSNQDYEIRVALDQAGPQTVYLTLDDFDVEWNSFCAYDYVIINGDVSNKLCGLKSGQEIAVEVPGDSFTVALHSDGSVEQRGFNISYTVAQEYTTSPVYDDQTSSTDLGDILARGYTFTSTDNGNYPSNTPDYAYPSYGNYPSYATDSIYTSYGNYPSYATDYIYPSYGNYPSSATDYVYPSYGNYPSYATDYMYSSYGNYPSYTADYGYNTGYTDSYVYSTYTDNYGYASSAYYPSYSADYGYGNYGNYPSYSSDYWNNNGYQGYSSYPSNTDSYYAYADYSPASATDSGSGSGSGRCPRREYHVTGDSGYLRSPNYPGTYASNEDFEMTVTLDQPGPQTVYLYFDDFDVEWNSDCAYDYVIVNGDVSNKLCGLKPGERMEVEIPGNTFTLTFHSDRSVENRGFDIYYTNSPGPREGETTPADQQSGSGTNLLGGLWQQIQDLNSGFGDTFDSWQTFQPPTLGSDQDTPLRDRIPTIPTRPPQIEPTPFFFPDYSFPPDVPPVESRPLEISQSQGQSATQVVEEPAPYAYAAIG